MFEPEKKRYLTRGVDESIPLDVQIFMWKVVDRMPKPQDYLQVFRLTEQNGLQVIQHTAEQPEYKMTYIIRLSSLLCARQSPSEQPNNSEPSVTVSEQGEVPPKHST